MASEKCHMTNETLFFGLVLGRSPRASECNRDCSSSSCNDGQSRVGKVVVVVVGWGEVAR